MLSLSLTHFLYLCLQSQSSCQTSLLGDPPKEVKLPSNPYLNLASVLPGVVLQGTCTIGTAHTEDDSLARPWNVSLLCQLSIFNDNVYSVRLSDSCLSLLKATARLATAHTSRDDKECVYERCSKWVSLSRPWFTSCMCFSCSTLQQ